MSDIKLFKLAGSKAIEVAGAAGGLEKSLQNLIEKNLSSMLGVALVASEHSTGKAHGGRIDTLGLDENGSPVIVEYKRAVSENVVSQGLFYLDWLLDHRAEFKLLVIETLGNTAAESIDWSGPRLICIASDFTRYDEHAVRQMDRNIDLIRYRRFGKELLALELVNRSGHDNAAPTATKTSNGLQKGSHDKPVQQALKDADPEIRDLFESLRAYLIGLGDDVQERRLKLYYAYRRIRNFASVVVLKKQLLVFLRVDPASIRLEDGFSRDMRRVGHWGTGDLGLSLKDQDDLRRAEVLLLRSYNSE
jgi:predicted transport protein